MFLWEGPLSRKRGMTLIDTLVGLAIFVLVFTALFAGVRLGISVIANNKAKTGALALLNEQMELIRSIPYDTLGTSGGIPSGSLSQSTTTRLNATNYTIRTLIQYVDQPQDGEGVLDANGITADAKQAKVEVTWLDRGEPRVLSMVTTVAPNGVESIAGGGTLRINVFDALAQPVPAAQVRVQNASLVPPVDVTTFTNSSGVVLFPGASAGSSYEVTVTKGGHSTDQTYDSGVGNPNPAPGHFTIAVGQTTTGSFSIDTLSTLIVRTFLPVLPDLFSDVFANASNIETLTDTEVTGGSVILLFNGTDYPVSGTVLSSPVEPSILSAWDEVSWSETLEAGTAVAVQVMQVDGAGVATLVPDIALPGNSTGFTVSPLSLDTVSTSTYPRLALQGVLTTSDVAVTPSLDEWSLSYQVGPTPLPNIPFTIRGTKTIGTTGGGAPIYKFEDTGDTGASSEQTFSNMEWDSYLIAQNPGSTGYDVMESCTPQPVSLSPGTTMYTDLTLTPQTANSVLVSVRSSAGALLPGVEVNLTRSGFSAQATTTPCGQAFFGGISAATYVIEGILSGYQTASTSVDVSGPAVGSLTLSP